MLCTKRTGLPNYVLALSARRHLRGRSGAPFGESKFAGLGQVYGDVAKFAVGGLGGHHQQVKRYVGADLESLHQDPFGLPDDITTVQRESEVFDLAVAD